MTINKNLKQNYTLRSALANKTIHILLTLGLLLAANLFANMDIEERFNIDIPKLSPITLPEITEFKMKNGVTVLLSEDNTFPTIRINLSAKAGSIYDTPDKIGIASMTAQLVRSGGTENYTTTELNQILDNMAISFNSNTRVLTVSFSMSFLAEDTERALHIFNEALRKPVFAEDSIQREKMRMNSAISRRNDEISDIAFREFHKLVYGADSPLARHTEYSTIKNISRQDLIDFHQNYYLPKSTYISIVGDFKTKDMKKLLTRTFGTWENDNKPQSIELDEELSFDSSVNLIPRRNTDQTWIIIGHRAEMTQKDPDYIPMIILNDILGGGFSSRIINRVRREMGLAYAPGAHFSVHLDSYGAFYLMSQTETSKTVEAIEALIDEVRIIQNEPVSDKELQSAKESYLNSFIFNYDATWKIINRQMTYKRFGYPEDFLEQIRNKVYDVTVDDIHRVAREYFRPDDFIILAVGDDGKFDIPLSSLGEVNEIDITIPQPKQEEQEITPTQIRKGQEIFERYRKAIGADTDIANIKFTGVSTQYREGDSSRVYITTYMEFPDRFRQNIATPRGDLSMIYNKGEGKMKTPAGDYPLPPVQTQEIISNMKSNPIGLANYFYEDFEIALLSEVQLYGNEYYVLSLSDEIRSFLLFIDKDTMLPYQAVYDDFQQFKTIYNRFSSYKKINGVVYPMKMISQDETGEVLSRSVYESVEFNVNIPNDYFGN